jgi:hypothetical protein
VEELAGAVSLANELDTRTNLLFDEIGSLRDQYQDQADVWIEISPRPNRSTRSAPSKHRSEPTSNQRGTSKTSFRMEVTERIGEFEAAGQMLSDLQWQVDDLNRRVAEAFGAEMASGGDDYSWQITDLQTKVAEIQGRQNAGVDIEWKLEDLENGLDWEIDELTRRVTELQVRMDTGGGVEQWQIDDLWNHSHDVWGRTEDLYIRTDDMYDMVLPHVVGVGVAKLAGTNTSTTRCADVQDDETDRRCNRPPGRCRHPRRNHQHDDRQGAGTRVRRHNHRAE